MQGISVHTGSELSECERPTCHDTELLSLRHVKQVVVLHEGNVVVLEYLGTGLGEQSLGVDVELAGDALQK